MKHLENNKIPFGLLNEEEQEYLKKYEGDIQQYSFNESIYKAKTSVYFHYTFVYQTVPMPLFPPSINWDHVSPDYNWLSRDGDGSCWFYKDKPKVVGSFSHFSSPHTASARSFFSLVKGTCDWKDSLVQRPKTDEEGTKDEAVEIPNVAYDFPRVIGPYDPTDTLLGKKLCWMRSPQGADYWLGVSERQYSNELTKEDLAVIEDFDKQYQEYLKTVGFDK